MGRSDSRNNISNHTARDELAKLNDQEFAKETYKLISKNKGSFSQLILDELNNGEILNIPSYIKEAFRFLLNEEAGELQ